jgi:hypothetical protein
MEKHQIARPPIQLALNWRCAHMQNKPRPQLACNVRKKEEEPVIPDTCLYPRATLIDAQNSRNYNNTYYNPHRGHRSCHGLLAGKKFTKPLLAPSYPTAYDIAKSPFPVSALESGLPSSI